MRDYQAMRAVLYTAATTKTPIRFFDMRNLADHDDLVFELDRLLGDGLIASTLEFDGSGACNDGALTGLTAEGREFWRLIENPEIWDILSETLSKAKVGVPYPLLKEVCEES